MFSVKCQSKLLLLVIFYTLHSCNGVCPPAEVMSPCSCESETIVCSGQSILNLKQIFAKISQNNSSKIFNEIILSNSAITELEDNVFADIGFKRISITGATNLKRISSLALNASAHTAEEFRQMGENQLSDEYVEQLFDALSSLVAVNRIFLDLTKATRIPDKAFKIVNGRQTKLENIHLNYVGAHYGSLESVGINPFYYLDNLKFISLANQPINHLSAKAFDFEKPSKADFDIHLEATKVTGQSFEEGIFLNANRPVTVELSYNKITYLEEKVFKPIFDLEDSKMVQFILEGNPLVCDCKMQWMTNDTSRLKLRVLEPECANRDKKSLWDLTKNDFPNC